jgi:hypothetical protein
MAVRNFLERRCFSLVAMLAPAFDPVTFARSTDRPFSATFGFAKLASVCRCADDKLLSTKLPFCGSIQKVTALLRSSSVLADALSSIGGDGDTHRHLTDVTVRAPSSNGSFGEPAPSLNGCNGAATVEQRCFR